MNQSHLFILFLLSVSITLSPFQGRVNGFDEDADKDKKDRILLFARLKRGMTHEQVHQLVGSPKHIARQILYHRYREEWVYDTPVTVRLTFDCPRGQKPQLLDTTGPLP
jgi:hypothetical protein